jgi:conjugative transfer signal peptidase TraF
VNAGLSSACSSGISTLAIAALIAVAVSGRHAPLLVFNATASAPIGFYRVLRATQLHTGDLVLIPTPDAVRELAAVRHYIPANVPLVKRVAAQSGAEICATSGELSIDGRHVAEQHSTDREGRTLPTWTGCHRLADDELFLLMEDVPDSFDSRYFGPVHGSDVIGRLIPLWPR